jgi:hypothetical protein
MYVSTVDTYTPTHMERFTYLYMVVQLLALL